MVEIAGNYRRYHCHYRTIILGDAPQKVKDLSSVVVEGIKEAETIKPGIYAEDEVWAKALQKRFIKDSRVDLLI